MMGFNQDIKTALKEQMAITGTSAVQLSIDCPWYPTVHLLSYVESASEESLAKLACYVNDPLRVVLLGFGREIASDTIHGKPSTAPVPEAAEPGGPEMSSVAAAPEDLEPSSESIPPLEPAEAEMEQLLTIKIPEPGTAPEHETLFQPYHTVDYFASQGIKTDSLTEGMTTRLDSQLKSFTQWLKAMKKVNYQTGEFIADLSVINQAQHSIETSEVVTETMAEVLVLQGMYPKAIEVYRKLSLLHPEKSAFFASQIEKLNAQQ